MNSDNKYLIILAAIIVLNFMYGFDARFTIINLAWILINLKWKLRCQKD